MVGALAASIQENSIAISNLNTKTLTQENEFQSVDQKVNLVDQKVDQELQSVDRKVQIFQSEMNYLMNKLDKLRHERQQRQETEMFDLLD